MLTKLYNDDAGKLLVRLTVAVLMLFHGAAKVTHPEAVEGHRRRVFEHRAAIRYRLRCVHRRDRRTFDGYRWISLPCRRPVNRRYDDRRDCVVTLG